ncbi:FHA domain-containing protein [Schumannella sp. 10F1B-5-1]|uniref:FHA domain-containing protein n=1 Tax=Schumannella sp. 10F1B-5-1 TaxID=2590780 RepID=UPI00112FF68F|nr:FHA domain-containing protein [Schumannella sp. 10F1B-5-1]TPW70703.1 FHA domain-containing protein [Schumannella sp. 10F1B-5-1]
MTSCRFCGSPLPVGALFCGECGRAVGATSIPAAVPVVVEPVPVVAVPSGEGARGSAAVAARPPVAQPTPQAEQRLVPQPELQPEPQPESEWMRDPDPEPERAPEPGAEPPPSGAPSAGAPPPAPAQAPTAEPLLPVPDLPLPPPAPGLAPGLPGLPPGQREMPVDLEQTRLVQRGSRPASWVLQFSTGESFTVSGSGLIGRNPVAQPAEFMDQLVPLFDAGKSVSKTHLEFGQDEGRFWVADRFSTNGTVVRPPDGPPRRCEPGRRYLVSRGTRIDIGEQFFVVS